MIQSTVSEIEFGLLGQSRGCREQQLREGHIPYRRISERRSTRRKPTQSNSKRTVVHSSSSESESGSGSGSQNYSAEITGRLSKSLLVGTISSHFRNAPQLKKVIHTTARKICAGEKSRSRKLMDYRYYHVSKTRQRQTAQYIAKGRSFGDKTGVYPRRAEIGWLRWSNGILLPQEST